MFVVKIIYKFDYKMNIIKQYLESNKREYNIMLCKLSIIKAKGFINSCKFNIILRASILITFTVKLLIKSIFTTIIGACHINFGLLGFLAAYRKCLYSCQCPVIYRQFLMPSVALGPIQTSSYMCQHGSICALYNI